MATVTANNDKGTSYSVVDGHRIVANMTLFSPGMPTNRTCTYKVEFIGASATPPKAMTGTLTRDMSDASCQVSSIVVMAETMTDVVIPLGIFGGRRVSYSVIDDAATATRTLTMKIRSLDGYGLNEPWHLELAILVLPGDVTTFDLNVVGAGMTIDSIDVTP